MAAAAEDGADALTAEAKAAADQAFKDYEAKRYKPAAQAFLRAYDLSGGRFPKQLRNAAKALYAGGFLDESLAVWARLANAQAADPEMRAEAQSQAEKVRSELVAQLQTQAESARKGKQHAQAGEQFARAFETSGGTRMDLLLAAAEAFEAANKLDDAHLSWKLAANALASQPAAQRPALTGQDRILARLRKLPGADSAYAAFLEKRWADAASALLRAFEQSPERAHLRLAAVALENANRHDDAEPVWARYVEAAADSRLATAEGRLRLDSMRRHRLHTEAEAALAADQDAAAGEKLLALYELSKGRDLESLRKAALAFERAGDLERARNWWQKLAVADGATDALRKEAENHLAGRDIAQKRSPGVVGVGKPDAAGLAAGATATATAPPPTCAWCTPSLFGGAAVAAVGAGVAAWASLDQAELLDSANKDASGKIVGIDHAAATARQSRNNLLYGAGLGAAVVGVGAAVAGWLWAPRTESVALPMLVPLPSGGAAVSWALAW